MIQKKKDDYTNAEGYPDPTAFKAIQNVDHDSERFRKFVGCILRICELSGYQLEEHIVVRDKITGKIWR